VGTHRAAIAALCVGSATFLAAAQATFTPLPLQPNTGPAEPTGISYDGSVIVGHWYRYGGREAVAWTPEGIHPFTALGSAFCNGVSGDGQTLVGSIRNVSLPPGYWYAIQWTLSGSMQNLGTLATSNPMASSESLAANFDGRVIVGASTSNSGYQQPFRWTPDTGMVGLGHLFATPTHARAVGVSGSGDVVIGWMSGWNPVGGNRTKAFRWRPQDGLTDLSNLLNDPNVDAEATAVSADGSTIVGSSASLTSGLTPFVWREATGMLQLPFTGSGGIATATTRDGELIVGHVVRADAYLQTEAVFWTPSRSIVRLQDYLIAGGATGLTGWRLTKATAISADGSTVVGTGFDPANNPVGWSATLPCQLIRTQPTNQLISTGSSVSFIVVVDAASDCSTPLTYQWQRRNPSIEDQSHPDAWVDLTDGAEFMHTQTGGLVIVNPIPALATGYRCKIGGGCVCAATGQYVYTDTVNFSIACPADFNSDGGVDFTDVEAFFERWENGC
jgi:probable HAF family extracellular repeat protein